jgi:hypothetical protein
MLWRAQGLTLDKLSLSRLSLSLNLLAHCYSIHMYVSVYLSNYNDVWF